MTVRARPISSLNQGPSSWLRVQRGQALSVDLAIWDNVDGRPLDWKGHHLRFRVYSQFVDQAVIMEVTDPQRCRFDSTGLVALRLTAEETAYLPNGGMRFTLEHRESEGDYRLGLRGGVSCCEN